MQVIMQTESICPECQKVLDATIFEENNKVYIEKECSEHGNFKEIYWSDFEAYQKAKKYDYIGDGIQNPITKKEKGCPLDCGLCPEHKSHTALAIIDITNRCNLRCPVCFATAGTTGYVYEPTQDEIKVMLVRLRENKPVPAAALQFSGGEPTVRKDLFDLVRMAKEVGFKHVEVNTNGIRLSQSVDYCRGLVESGVSTIYLQFDGVTSEVYKFNRGVDLVEVKKKAIANLREAGLDSIVLVVTLVKGVNDHQLGDVIRFAADNFDVVRCVNVQPVSFCGRVPERDRKRMRITIPDFMRLVEEQTDGIIKASDFYPVTTVVPISRAVGALKKKRYVEFTAHPHCGAATYVLVEDGEIKSILEQIDIENFTKSLQKAYEEFMNGHESRGKMRLLGSLRHVKLGVLRKYMFPLIKTGSYKVLGDLHRKMLMISSMHFMDPYNFDLERVKRCVIHFATPDGRIIPFCTMNSIHRMEIEKRFGVPIEEWQKKHKTKVNSVA